MDNTFIIGIIISIVGAIFGTLFAIISFFLKTKLERFIKSIDILTEEVKGFGKKHATYDEHFQSINKEIETIAEEIKEQQSEIKKNSDEILKLRVEHDSINCIKRAAS